MKKFLSTILAVVMVLSSMAMVVSANDVDYAEGYYYVNGVQYTDFMAAVSAANGGTVIVSGECAFSSRLAVNSSVTLQGVNDATIVPSASYGSTDSDTNWKGLLNIQASDVTINDITFDGSLYGIGKGTSTDFVVLRINEGTDIVLDNVTVLGSERTLISIGTSSTSAEVEVGEGGLYCEAPMKKLSLVASYADILVKNGRLDMDYGIVNGFIAEDKDTNAGTIDVGAAGHYTFEYTTGFKKIDIATTPKHIANSYLDNNLNVLEESAYISLIGKNDAVTQQMMQYVYNNRNTLTEEMTDLNTMLDDMIAGTIFGAYKTELQNYKAILAGTVTVQ
ncbi:MAG: hypothetical protein IKA17_07745 [Clostridia bacterium]|nr:hypothetical protein [Clostridia bacterium]